MQKLEFWNIVGDSVKCYNHLHKGLAVSYVKPKYKPTHGPEISPQGIYSRETEAHIREKMYTRIFVATLFKIAKYCK